MECGRHRPGLLPRSSPASDLRRPPGAPVRVHSQTPLAAGGARPRDPRGEWLWLHAAGRLPRPHRRRRPGGPRGSKDPCPAPPPGPSPWEGLWPEAGWGLRGAPERPVSAQAAGLREGDYIVSVNGRPCRWWKHAEVVAQLTGAGDEGVSLQVVTLLPSTEPPGTVSPRAAGGWSPAPGPGPPDPRPPQTLRGPRKEEAGPRWPCPGWPGQE